MQLGIRLHDVNAALVGEEQTLEARAAKAREEGFSCVHLALSKCVTGVTFDAEKHSVTFTAVSTDCGLDMQLEFLFVGPGSDHDYESMFVTDAPVREIAAAFDKAGIPRGRPFDPDAWRLWPVGVELELEPAFPTLVREMRGDKTPGIVYASGTRCADGSPAADTNMPSAVFALYNCPQSLVQLDDSLDQSPTYGRFQPAEKIAKGERRTFTVRWNGKANTTATTLRVTRDGFAAELARLKELSKEKGGCLDVLCDFSPEMTLADAAKASEALAMIDSQAVKLCGAPEGQYYFRAYLPL